MTTQTTLTGDSGQATPPRPGSRAARMAHPTIVAGIRQVAIEQGVCIRPQAMRRTNEATGQTELVEFRCGATTEKKCLPCAERAKKLRQAQCRDGWHRDTEPTTSSTVSDDEEGLILLRADLEYARTDCLSHARFDQVAELDDAIREVDEMMTHAGLRGRTSRPRRGSGEPPRRKRSTRRRQDVPDLPRRKMTARTVGRTFAVANGKTYRPSTFLTLTLPSYGRVRDDGSPIDPTTYDYRRAAWDAVQFPALLDRFWQNLRRAEGWNMQYFGSVEPQRRLAPHAHFAIRGTMPHAVMRQVVAATYHQVWWPSTATVVYDEHEPQPVWDQHDGGFVNPASRVPLPTWGDAMATLDDELDDDPDREPDHVIRFGAQVKPVGVLAGTDQAERLIGYLSKYIIKAVGDCHSIDTPTGQAHQHRLWEELRYTPCSDRCPNWVRYGIQPRNAHARMRAGHCKAKVHQPDTLGLGGRRVLVSREWSGKTLADHRYDQLAWVRRILQLGLDDGHDDQAAVEAARAGEAPDPISWTMARPGDPDLPDYTQRLLHLISTRIQQREALREAQAIGPPHDLSAIDPGIVRSAA